MRRQSEEVVSDAGIDTHDFLELLEGLECLDHDDCL